MLSSVNKKYYAPVIERLSGGRWNTVTPALPPDADTFASATLTSISCPTANWCAAGGWYYQANGQYALYVSTLTDGSWTAAPLPLPSNAAPNSSTSGITAFADVSCTAAGACTAVGEYRDTSGGSQAFTATLSGGTWATAQVPLPDDAATTGQAAGLFGISCPAPGTCVAGGHYLNRDNQARYLIDTLSEGKWTSTAAPLPADAAADQKWSQDQATTLSGVACESASDCVASAGYVSADNEMLPSVATLSNEAWSSAGLPLPADASMQSGQAGAAFLGLIRCPAPGDCVSVGSYPVGNDDSQGLIETATAKRD